MNWDVGKNTEWGISTKRGGLKSADRPTNNRYETVIRTDRLTEWLTDWLISWLTDWPTDWLIHWLIDGLTDWLIDWLTHWLIHWLINRLTHWLIDLLTHWLTDSLTDWLIDRLTHWQFDWLNDWLIDWFTDWITNNRPVSDYTSVLHWYVYVSVVLQMRYFLFLECQMLDSSTCTFTLSLPAILK